MSMSLAKVSTASRGDHLVMLAGGAWAVVKFFAGRDSSSKATPPPGRTTVRAGRGGIVGGQDVSVRTSHGVSGLHVVLLVSIVLLAGGLLGKRITAQDCGIAAGANISGSTITAGCGAPAGK